MRGGKQRRDQTSRRTPKWLWPRRCSAASLISVRCVLSDSFPSRFCAAAMPPRRAQASVDPYGEDDTIVLPDGCIAEDVEIDFGYNHTNDAAEANHNANGTATQRPLTYGLDSTHMATISAAAKQRAISPSGHDDDELAGGESTPLSAEAVVESTKQRREARRKSSSINHPGKRTWWSYLPCFPSVPSIDERFGRKFTFGERLADRVSGAVGSWPFVCTQTVALFSWILFNVLFNGPDPFPFILLNLCLSFQAAYTGQRRRRIHSVLVTVRPSLAFPLPLTH